MEAKDPCVDCPDIIVDNYGYLCDLACGKRTAWLNFQAGIREVVEFIKSESALMVTKDDGSTFFLYSGNGWQAQLKEWGVDKPKK